MRRDNDPEPVSQGDAVAIAETDKALLVEIDGDEKWVPKSVIHDNSEVWKKGDEGTIVVEGWWGRAEGWD
jgi:hypothetical protein